MAELLDHYPELTKSAIQLCGKSGEGKVANNDAFYPCAGTLDWEVAWGGVDGDPAE